MKIQNLIKQKGFTIIELIVVIAIIAVLSTISGGNANADYVKINAALTATNMGYTLAKSCDQVNNCVAGTVPADTKWCAMVTLKVSGDTYCVDSSGKKITKI